MPALLFCRRRWYAASDDFVFFPSLFALIRLAIVIYVGVRFGMPNPRDTWVDAYNEGIHGGVYSTDGSSSYASSSSSSSGPHYIAPFPDADHTFTMLGVYCLCIVVVDTLCFVSDIALALSSYSGTVLAISKRHFMVNLALTVRIIFVWFELGIAIFGAVFLYATAVNDTDKYFVDGAPMRSLLTMSKIINLAQFGFVVVIFIAFISYFDPDGHKEKRIDNNYAQEWGKRCKIFFCCVWAEKKAKRTARRMRSSRSLRRSSSGSANGSMIATEDEEAMMKDAFDMDSVAELFANMFRNVDLVPSDIAAGLVLLRKKQKFQAKELTDARQLRSRRDSVSPVLLERSKSSHSYHGGSVKISTQHTSVTKKLTRGDLLLLEETHYYVNYVVGAYGWPMTAMANPITFPFKICGKCFCGQPKPVPNEDGSPSNHIPNYDGDNCCHCNIAAMRYWLGDCRPHHTSPNASPVHSPLPQTIDDSTRSKVEIIYYSRDNDVFVVPFFIAHDDERRVLVVSIRGTLSIHDAFTDLNAAAEPLNVGPLNSGATYESPRGRGLSVMNTLNGSADGKRRRHRAFSASSQLGEFFESDDDGDASRETAPLVEGYVHKGMFHCAEALYRKLMLNGDISSTVEQQAGAEDVLVQETCNLPQLLASKRYRGYKLIVTGHSLGAGVAAIVGCMLASKIPAMHVYAFSPPGGLLSDNLATFSESFCTSVAVGKDLVPRLSEIAIAELRDGIMTSLAETSRSKATILGGCCTKNPHFLLNVKRDHDADPTDEPSMRLREYRQRTRDDPVRIQLYPPGVVWHLQKTHSTRRQKFGGHCCEQARVFAMCGCVEKHDSYYPIVVPRDHFKSILVSPIMVRDHMPWNVKAAIDRVILNANSGELDLIADEVASGTTVLDTELDDLEDDAPLIDRGAAQAGAPAQGARSATHVVNVMADTESDL